jgi:Holliday junction DNA helicase RuvA
MIAKLTGVVDSKTTDAAVVDVAGVGYLVFGSARMLNRLPAAGGAISLFIETHVREDHIHLYGFAEKAERDWFRLLTSVQGVGARIALAILSVASPEQLVQSIAAQDKAILVRASGVGPKLAIRILTELKDKAGAIALSTLAAAPVQAGQGAATVIPGETGALADAVSALVNLGYQRMIAFQAVGRAGQLLGEKAEVPALIRAALKELAPKENVR